MNTKKINPTTLPGYEKVAASLLHIQKRMNSAKYLGDWKFASWPRLEAGELFGIHVYAAGRLFYLTFHREWDAVRVPAIGHTAGKHESGMTNFLRSVV